MSRLHPVMNYEKASGAFPCYLLGQQLLTYNINFHENTENFFKKAIAF